MIVSHGAANGSEVVRFCVRTNSRFLTIVWVLAGLLVSAASSHAASALTAFQKQIWENSRDASLITSGEFGWGVTIKYFLATMIVTAIFEVIWVKLFWRVRWGQLGKAIALFLAIAVGATLVHKAGSSFFEVSIEQLKSTGPPPGYLWFIRIVTLVILIAYVSVRMEIYQIGVWRALFIHLASAICIFAITVFFIVPGIAGHARQNPDANKVLDDSLRTRK